MRGRRVLLVALLLTAFATPARAAAGQFVVSGSGGAQIVLTRAGTLDLDAMIPDAHAEVSGLVIRDRAGGQLATVVRVRRWTSGLGAPQALSTRSSVRLAPGTYRVDLLATGPATVRVPATGGLVRSVAATGRARGRVLLADLLAASPPVREHRYTGLRVSPGGAALLAFFARTRAHQASSVQLCFPRPGGSCLNAAGSTAVLASPGSAGDGYVSAFSALYGGEGVDGAHDALVEDVTVDLPTVLDALLVTTD